VLPSMSEGLSNSLLESMAAGVPVVATRVGGSPEAVEDGVSGFLVPPRDAAALAEGMNALLGDAALARRLGEAARRRIADHFSLESMTRELERLYLRLLRGERPQATHHATHGPGPGPFREVN
jgi:glycosyltransferase involved in cell wall biosynthesis